MRKKEEGVRPRSKGVRHVYVAETVIEAVRHGLVDGKSVWGITVIAERNLTRGGLKGEEASVTVVCKAG